MNTKDLFNQLVEIRKAAVSIIKDVMTSINITDIDVSEYNTPFTHEGDEPYALANISLLPDGHLIFDSDSEFDTIVESEDDLSADVLLEIAQWMETNKDDFSDMEDEG